MAERKKGLAIGSILTRAVRPILRPDVGDGDDPSQAIGQAARDRKLSGAKLEDPRRIIREGLIVVGIFFGGLGLWSVLGTITGAVVAPGKIKVENERKVVQHLEGGIVDAILVHEGEEVSEGQPLLVLESVQIDASANLLHKQLIALLASQHRLAVEKELGSELQWSDELQKLAAEYGSPDVLENERKIFVARRDSYDSQLSLLQTQLAQLDAQIAGFEDQARAERTIIGTLNEELKAKRQLYRERYLEKSQVLELERALASHQGNLGRLRQSVAEARQRAAEVRLREEALKVQFVEDATNNLGRVENEVIQTRERIRPLKDARVRLQIKAPVSGMVVGLKVHSRGGVIRPGEVLMDIVPKDNPLVVETHVPVNKITEVHVGQEALVSLDAFDTRVIPHMPGKVTYISADRLEEQTFGGQMPYYLCYVTIDPKALEENELYMAPGMPATVFITTSKTSVLYYMLEPLIKGWDRALRD